MSLDEVDSFWAWLERQGDTRRMIARRAGVSVRTVQLGIARAVARKVNPPPPRIPRPPRLTPLFGCRPWTPQSECPHRGLIGDGDRVCCMVCHRTGIEKHPALCRNPRTDPPREPRAKPAEAWPKAKETRRARRARLFARALKDVTAYLETVPADFRQPSENG
jgi:hypothetical protein